MPGEGHWEQDGAGWYGGGVGSLRVHPSYEDQLLSAGGDGLVRQWEVTYVLDGSDVWLSDQRVVLQPLRTVATLQDAAGRGRLLLSVDWCSKAQRHAVCMVADAENDIWMLPEPGLSTDAAAADAEQQLLQEESEPANRPTGSLMIPSSSERPLLEGQSGDVYNVAPHPTHAACFATACEDGCVYLWDGGSRRSLPPSPFPVTRMESEKRPRRYDDFTRHPSRHHAKEVLKARCLAFHPSGMLLAVGSSGVARTADGDIQFGAHDDMGGVLSLYYIHSAVFGGKLSSWRQRRRDAGNRHNHA